MTPSYLKKPLDGLFATRDPTYHKGLKRPVGQLFSMANMRNYEPYVDECSEIFVNKMRQTNGQVIDLSAWLQWYAFDVIAYITFRRRFGFMEEGCDVNNMIRDIDDAFQYVKIIGQYPGLHRYLMGNETFILILRKIFPDLPDVFRSFLTVKIIQSRQILKTYTS